VRRVGQEAWVTEVERYDAVIIGSGQAGGPLSTDLVKAGRKTALVEREHIGGTCINEGCTPTKTMVASAESVYAAQRSGDYGILIDGGISVNMPEVRRRKRRMVEQFRTHSLAAIQAGGVDVIMGEARFLSPTDVCVEATDGTERRLTSGLFVINAGARPSKPPIPGMDQVPTLNSTSIMELDRVPDHLIVIGGGYVGVEFGQMFRRFGSRVTVVQQGPALLAREDDDVAETVAGILHEDGIDILLQANTTRAELDARGQLALDITVGDQERRVLGSHVLVATGRIPNTEQLDLRAAGVAIDAKGFVVADERLWTGVDGIYAVGDAVSGNPAFTHISYDDFRILRTNLIEGGHRTRKGRLVPYTVFMDPQLGRVGLTEKEAHAQNRDFKVAKMPMTHVARALEVGETRGMMKALVDTRTGHILGCAILGMEGGELMAMIEIAMIAEVPYTKLRDGIFAHPTLAEGFNTLFGTLTG